MIVIKSLYTFFISLMSSFPLLSVRKQPPPTAPPNCSNFDLQPAISGNGYSTQMKRPPLSHQHVSSQLPTRECQQSFNIIKSKPLSQTQVSSLFVAELFCCCASSVYPINPKHISVCCTLLYALLARHIGSEPLMCCADAISAP